MFKFFAIKTYSDIDLAPISELRYSLGLFSIFIANYNSFSQAAKVAKRLNRRSRKDE